VKIIVYTKPDCKLCASFKEKLRTHLKVPFSERDLEKALRLSDSWREDKTHQFKAAHVLLNEPVPFIVIDETGYDYAGAIAEIKRRLEAGEEATMPDPERDRSMDVLGPPLTEEEFVTAVWGLCGGNVDLLRVTSPVDRTYCEPVLPETRREVHGQVDVLLHYRDANAKPMCMVEFTTWGAGFREALRNLNGQIEGAKNEGQIWVGVRGEYDATAGTEAQAGGDRGEDQQPDGA
jgi:glutaredoxin